MAGVLDNAMPNGVGQCSDMPKDRQLLCRKIVDSCVGHTRGVVIIGTCMDALCMESYVMCSDYKLYVLHCYWPVLTDIIQECAKVM